MLPVEEFRKLDTPFYYYDLDLLRQTLRTVRDASAYPGFRVHYAVKANANPEILRIISDCGLGADTVSGGEIRRALECGFPARSIVYAGVGKSPAELREALRDGIGCINVESAEELAIIDVIAGELGVVAPVALRINPDIDAHTHHYITTGLEENKFGIDRRRLDEVMERLFASPRLQFRGFHFHIGSQITTLEPFRLLCERINDLQDIYEDRYGVIPTINVGGGLGIDYDDPAAHPVPDFDDYFRVFHDHLRVRPGQEIHFELGRSIVGQCGSLISRVLYVKQGVNKKFVILDAGFTDLIRPALYGARHLIENLTSTSTETDRYDVVGPICESTDTFGLEERLPLTRAGDLIAIRSAGAYGQIMASQYNLRPLPPAVYSK